MDLSLLPYLHATHDDPNQMVRCADQISHEVRSYNRRPTGDFDICLECLQDQYRWMIPLTERYCDEGKLSIYYRKHLRFTSLAAFEAAYEADPSTDEAKPDLPVQYRFSHTYIFQLGWE